MTIPREGKVRASDDEKVIADGDISDIIDAGGARWSANGFRNSSRRLASDRSGHEAGEDEQLRNRRDAFHTADLIVTKETARPSEIASRAASALHSPRCFVRG